MDTTFSFTISTTNPRLAAQLSEVVSDFQEEEGEGSAHIRPEPAFDETVDAALVSQILDGLSYKPLHPTQILALKVWYGSTDWVHVGVVQQEVLKEGLAKDAAEAVARVRGLLAGFAIRMGQKVTRAGARSKLETFLDVRRADGTASHRLSDAGRAAVKRFLKL